ncbi:myelin-oligodendrocyte glycoprotein-like isoform X3 [Archocentrus centrarchus]|uniref:myelin-oligodendrocyte glycoprotein-like isoform X3 n=1 Tax=Archocentrus centrarchus TaxID=63155 RepID=UPI0011EA2079|nr:myelin-oligodendrocyte glycoprotein-like isoform X3 [Archocentrus centrarchus]
MWSREQMLNNKDPTRGESSRTTQLLGSLGHTNPSTMIRWRFTEESIFICEVLVIGSSLPIIAAPGDDVILPCHLEPMIDVRGLTVEWSKPDLKPDPSDQRSQVKFVHLYRHQIEVLDMKLASYFRRTELFMDDLKHGNISLKILNVSEEDSGRYRCFIPKLRSSVKAAIVQLVVDPNFPKTSTTEMWLHPRNLQTPDPQDEIPGNAGRSRVSVVIVAIVFISVAALAAYSSHHLCLKLNGEAGRCRTIREQCCSSTAPLGE